LSFLPIFKAPRFGRRRRLAAEPPALAHPLLRLAPLPVVGQPLAAGQLRTAVGEAASSTFPVTSGAAAVFGGGGRGPAAGGPAPRGAGSPAAADGRQRQAEA
jgi:hypothetical protein